MPTIAPKPKTNPRFLSTFVVQPDEGREFYPRGFLPEIFKGTVVVMVHPEAACKILHNKDYYADEQTGRDAEPEI